MSGFSRDQPMFPFIKIDPMRIINRIPKSLAQRYLFFSRKGRNDESGQRAWDKCIT